MDVLSSYSAPKQKLLTISEASDKPTHTVVDIIPRPHDERMASTHFKHLYQTELREEEPNTMYRYQNNNYYHPSTSLKDRTYRMDNDIPEKQGSRSGERNKVKFSDTVTIAVVSVSHRLSCKCNSSMSSYKVFKLSQCLPNDCPNSCSSRPASQRQYALGLGSVRLAGSCLVIFMSYLEALMYIKAATGKSD